MAMQYLECNFVLNGWDTKNLKTWKNSINYSWEITSLSLYRLITFVTIIDNKNIAKKALGYFLMCIE